MEDKVSEPNFVTEYKKTLMSTQNLFQEILEGVQELRQAADIFNSGCKESINGYKEENKKAFEQYVELTNKTISTNLNKLEEENSKLFKIFKEDAELSRETIYKDLGLLIEKQNKLISEIAISDGYSQYLEEKVKSLALEQQNNNLERQLNHEKITVETFLDSTSRTINNLTTDINKKLNEIVIAESLFNKCIEKYNASTTESTKNLIETTEEKMDQTRSDCREIVENNIVKFKDDCKKNLEDFSKKCEDYLTNYKEKSIEFLKECMAQNEKLSKNFDNEKKKEKKEDKYKKQKDALIIFGIISNLCFNIFLLFLT